MMTLATALTPCSVRNGGWLNRVSGAVSGEIIGLPVCKT